MRTSKKLLKNAVVSVCLAAAPSFAPAQNKPLNWIKMPTRTVLLACQDAHSEHQRVKAVGRTICESLVSAYVDGFMRGAIWGSGQALIYDGDASDSVQGIEGFNRRLDALDPRKTCSDTVFDLDAVVSSWAVRVYSADQLDEVLDSPYTMTLYDTISKDFCAHR